MLTVTDILFYPGLVVRRNKLDVLRRCRFQVLIRSREIIDLVFLESVEHHLVRPSLMAPNTECFILSLLIKARGIGWARLLLLFIRIEQMDVRAGVL